MTSYAPGFLEDWVTVFVSGYESPESRPLFVCPRILDGLTVFSDPAYVAYANIAGILAANMGSDLIVLEATPYSTIEFNDDMITRLAELMTVPLVYGFCLYVPALGSS